MKLSQIMFTIFLNLVITFVLLQFENKSNFNSKIMVPIISSLIIKYILGDWDVGYQWSVSDIYYWVSLLSTSFIFVYVYS